MSNTKALNAIVDRRYDFVFLFDVTDGNPDGDPDAGNLPRMDPQALQGFVTDVCIKRKIRNAVAALGKDQPGTNLYFQTQDAVYEKRILRLLHQEAYNALTREGKITEPDTDNPKIKADNTAKAREWMCRQFYDIRAFGAVMTLGVNCGQVRGPVQITFARSAVPRLRLREPAAGRRHEIHLRRPPLASSCLHGDVRNGSTRLPWLDGRAQARPLRT
jgi:CRISPR-associated protein Csd2